MVYLYSRNYNMLVVGQDSVVGTRTRYKLNGPVIELQLQWDFLHLSRLALGPIDCPVQWVLGLFQE